MSVATVIYNPASGSAADVDRLRDEFGVHANGHRLRWAPTTEDDPGFGQTTEAVDQGSETVIACGGDGTVRAVIERLAGTPAALGIVPLGTGNLLATNLELRSGFEAIPTALSAPPTVLDVAVVNDERFAVMAGVGFDAMMIRDANPAVKRRLGSAAYVISGARNVPAQVVAATIVVDGDELWSGRTAMVLVGNCGSVTGGLPVFPEARPDDGILDVAVLTAENARDWVTVMWRLVRRRPQPDRLVRRFCGREIEVELERPMAYELDGEDRDPTRHLTFRVEPQALQVRC